LPHFLTAIVVKFCAFSISSSHFSQSVGELDDN
jgi:hypothetical protein